MLPVSLFNVARYLTDSLGGPVLQTLRRARSASLMGWDGNQKYPLIFFILCGYRAIRPPPPKQPPPYLRANTYLPTYLEFLLKTSSNFCFFEKIEFSFLSSPSPYLTDDKVVPGGLLISNCTVCYNSVNFTNA